MTRPTTYSLFGLIALAWQPQQAAAANSGDIYSQWTPDIFKPSQTAPAILEVAVTADVASVSFVRGQEAPRPLRNDGQGGDALAGDRVFTIRFEAAEILAWYNGFGAQYRFRISDLGLLRFANAAGSIVAGRNLQLPVKTDAIPRVPLTALASNAQFTSHVFNAAMPRSFFLAVGDTSEVTPVFYTHFHDRFEFITLVFDGQTSRGTHFTRAQEFIGGLGRAPYSLSPDWAAPGSSRA